MNNDLRNEQKIILENTSILLKQIELERSKNDVWMKDNAFLKADLHLKNKRIRILKIGLFTVSAVAVLEIGYIGYQAIKKGP